jgi:hypothetical protein
MNNSINESLVDAWKDRVIQYHTGSDTSLKCACIVAAHVVGSYSGMTGVIAKETKRSVSTVENWAHGFRLYKELRQVDKNARVYWRKLPASHWWLAYDIQRNGYDAFHYLTNAYLNKWSGRDMMQEYKRDIEAGTAPIQYKRMVISFRGLAMELSKRTLTKEQRVAVDNVLKVFRD